MSTINVDITGSATSADGTSSLGVFTDSFTLAGGVLSFSSRLDGFRNAAPVTPASAPRSPGAVAVAATIRRICLSTVVPIL
jgi:hypothetical protein